MIGKDTVRVLDFGDACPRLDLVGSGGSAIAGVWPGVGATMRSMHRIELAAGGRTRPLTHPMEAVYYVRRGSGGVGDGSSGKDGTLVEGSMVHIEPGTLYAFVAGPDGLELIGGPCPHDPELYRQIKA